jgi:nanoRNase/pAp phosphatase (c-di-AMP/oligoRNAs hydrolase)
MRSKCVYFDAGKICHDLGGGGHPGAAGCTLEGKLKDARKTIEEALVRALGNVQTAASDDGRDELSPTPVHNE